MSDPDRTPAQSYLDTLAAMLGRLRDAEMKSIRAAAGLVADALAGGGHVHAFGSGHSHVLALEMFYRAGGLVRVKPILFEGLMLHASAPLSTALERQPDIADALLADHPMAPGDVLIVASNSGGNAVARRLVELVRPMGVKVVAITSRRYATSDRARAADASRVHDLADVVIDNGGVVGDAVVEIRGLERPVAPTSTVLGAAIVNAIVAEAAQLLVDRGQPPQVFTSSNLEGGDAANAALLPSSDERP